MILLVVISISIPLSFSASIVPVISPYRGQIMLDCSFSFPHHSTLLKNIYTCIASEKFQITKSGSEVTFIRGIHMVNKTNNDVIGFKVGESRVEYFPKGLEKIFKNLLSILITMSNLKELKQSDVMGFKKLRHLDLYYNRIEYLERDLFKFNEDLQVVWFTSNRIKVIHETAFNGPKNLTNLYLGDNICVRVSADTPEGVQSLLSLIKQICRIPPDNIPDETTLQPDPNDVLPLPNNETEILKRQILMLEDEIFNLKQKRENILIKMIKIEKENENLNQRVIELHNLTTWLNATMKKGDLESVAYILEATRMRDELRKQGDNLDKVITTYKQQMTSLNSSLNDVIKERNFFKDTGLQRLKDYHDVSDQLFLLQQAKESRDLVNIYIILVLLIGIVALASPNIYARLYKKPSVRFNGFENSMRASMINEN